MSSNQWMKKTISAILALGLGATASGTFAAAKSVSNNNGSDKAASNLEKCYGVVKKGMNDCGAYDHSCQGESKINGDPNEWILLPKGTCEKIVGGSLKPKDEGQKEQGQQKDQTQKDQGQKDQKGQK